MNTTELTAEIARRLPRFSRRDIREVLEVMTELCHAELGKMEGEVHLTGLGKLYTEAHWVKCAGVMRRVMRAKSGGKTPDLILRHSVRFRPSDALRVALNKRE